MNELLIHPITPAVPPAAAQATAIKIEQMETTLVPLKKQNFLRLALQDQILFAKRLSILVRAGVPILKSLQMMQTQARTKSGSKIFAKIVFDVENGQFLSTSLSQFKKIFSEFMVNLVQVGEISGNLHENLNYLADELSKKQALRRKIVNAMVYPALIITATLGIIVMLTVYLFPKILPIFSSFKFKLPLSTKILIVASDVMIHYGLYILLGLIVFGVIYALSLRNRKFKTFTHRMILAIPIVGTIARSYHLTNICRTLSILLKSGVTINRGIHITAKTSTNFLFQDNLVAMADSVNKGEMISTHMLKTPKLYPAILVQMVAVGESAGNLTETLAYLSEMYENEVDDQTKNLSTALEPILMISMGVIVGFIAISIITPIYQITQYLKP
ncbi:MAG: type II secretion system F family protein [Acidobacteriaceae bacterium]